jgi:N-acetylmuramoyl-L-alanine amidase
VWHAYTEIQIQKALELAELLVRHITSRMCLGMKISLQIGREIQVPVFPLEHVRAIVLDREGEEPECYEVTVATLNIRSGPSVEFPPDGEPLKRGTESYFWKSATDGIRWNW